MSRKILQSGHIHVVIAVILFVGLVGAVGFAAWQGMQKKTDNNVETPKTSSAADSSKKIDTTPTPDEYFRIASWGVKFRYTDAVKKVTSYKVDAMDGYDFSTPKVEALGERCDAGSDAVYLVRLSRETKKIENPYDTPLNDNRPINGYYYYLAAGQSLCSNAQGTLQQQERDNVIEMLKGIELL